MKTPKWYSIHTRTALAAAALGVAAAAEIFIYGDIGESWYDETVTAAQFVKDLQALEVDQITVRINSMGGSVPDGIAIHNAIKRHKATVTVEVDGMALSIASLIAMAGDKVHMAANAVLMIHAPWTYTYGNSAELRETADRLDTWAGAMATSYAGKTGRDKAEMLALVSDGKDHYYTAEEALAGKFIDAISDETPATAQALAAARLVACARYRDVPAALQAGGGAAAASAAAPSVAIATQTQETDMKLRQTFLATALLMAAAGEHGSDTGGTGNTPAAPAAGAAPDAKAILAAERGRQDAISAAFKPHMALAGVGDLLARVHRDETVTPEAAGLQLLALLGASTQPVAGGGVRTVEDERDKRQAAASSVLLARAGVRPDGKVIVLDGANPFRGSTLLDLAKASLVHAGVRIDGLDKMGIVAAAFTNSSSDFPILLENTMHKALQAAYATQPLTWNRWCKTGSVSDFRAHKRYRRGSFGTLDSVNEAAEYKTKKVPDGEKATITAATKGNLVNLTRVAIINDDLDAFMGIATDLGMAAARTVEADAIAILTANAALVQDNVALFHADHANLGTGGVPSVTTFDEGRSLMAKQTGVGGNDYLDLRPAIWLGPTALGASARVVNDAQYDPDTANKLQRPNSVRGLVRDVIDTPRLTGTAWYLLADPSVCPTVEVAFLDGVQTPYLELQNGFTVDGAQWKVRLDYGTAAMDYRGAVKNAGA